jgi:hypothetical protein
VEAIFVLGLESTLSQRSSELTIAVRSLPDDFECTETGRLAQIAIPVMIR